MVNTSTPTNSLENFFMPFTANKDFKKEPRLLEKGEGVYYYNHKGDKVIDCSSGLFCVPLGHGRREIADAVHQQLLKLDYAPSFAISHMPAFTLAERLAKMLPGDLNNIFFTICGSTAIDSAIKIIQAYQHAKGQSQRIRFVSRERAYHGVNIGGTSLSGMIKNREVFTATMPGVVHLRHTWLEENKFNLGQPEHGDYLADDLQRFVDMYGPESIAGCFVEPIAGSTGTLVPPKGYLEKLRATCDKHGIVLVFDEVITGFGRTGEAFGANKYNVQPDMITMAKAITNGAQPMGAVAVSDDIYNTIINSGPEHGVEFFHGYTYSAHPACVAASHATLDIYENEGIFEKAKHMSSYFLNAVMDELKDIPIVTDVRGDGLMAGIDLAVDGKPGVRGYDAQRKIFANGGHVKFTGDCGIIAPALISTEDQIDEMISVTKEVLVQY
jgi:beta-alanine--pyruvate transaminase